MWWCVLRAGRFRYCFRFYPCERTRPTKQSGCPFGRSRGSCGLFFTWLEHETVFEWNWTWYTCLWVRCIALDLLGGRACLIILVRTCFFFHLKNMPFPQHLYYFQYDSGVWNMPYGKRHTSRTGHVFFFFFFFYPIHYLRPSITVYLPPRRNSDPGSHSSLFSPPTHYGSCLAFL